MNRMNMKRLSLVFAVLLLAFTQHVHAQYYSVNYDARTVAAMAAAFGTEAWLKATTVSRSMTS